jgi:predicted nucleic acid-binding protein
VIAVDAGPLLALLNADDRHHARCVGVLREVDGPLATTWIVLADVLDRLRPWPTAQDAVHQLLDRGVLRLAPLDDADRPRLRDLGRVMPGAAQASLVRIAERDRLDAVFTLEPRAFAGTSLTLIPVSAARRGPRGRTAGARAPRARGSRPGSAARRRPGGRAPARSRPDRRTRRRP